MADEQTADVDEKDQTPVEATEESVQADLAALVDEVRALAVQALDECRELRAIVVGEAISEKADENVLDDSVEPDDLQIEDLLA